MKLDVTKLKEFFDLATERHFIYVKKELLNKPKPWTKDEIFKNWRFCNVFRHLDKVSQYIIKNVIYPNENNPELWKGIFVSRFFSRIETIECLLENNCLFSDFTRAINLLQRLKDKQPIMTSSFILNPLRINGKYVHKLFTPYEIIKVLTATAKVSLSRFKTDPVDTTIAIDAILRKIPTIEGMVKMFKALPSTAGFMAYEYATDFTYSQRYFKTIPTDYYTYGNFTIGSLRGLKRLLNIPINKSGKLPIKELTMEILQRWKEYVNKNSISTFFMFEKFGDLSMREVEHWLCEYDKYMRIHNKETDRLKGKYNGN